MHNLPELDGILDLWGATWEPADRRVLEDSLIRAIADEAQPLAIRRAALSACHVLATERLVQTIGDTYRDRHFSAEELLDIERDAVPLRHLLHEAQLLRGNLGAVEALCRPEAACVPSLDALLDLVDVRDLIALARSSIRDAATRRELTRRLLKRGKHQRARAREAFQQAADSDEPYAEYALELR